MSDFSPEPTVVRRHRLVLVITFALALVLAITAAEHDRSTGLIALAICSVAPIGLAAALPRMTNETLAAAAGASLLSQAVAATLLFGEGAHPSALLLTAFAVVAVYRTSWVLFATGVGVVAGQIGLTIAGVDHLEASAMEASQGAGSTIYTVSAAIVGAWALVTVWRDHRIAERVAAERDELAATYREVVPLVTIQLDPHGNLIDANRQTCLMLDRELEDIVGQNWFTLALPAEYQEQAIEYFKHGFRPTVDIFEEIDGYTNEIVGADGHRRLVDWKAAFLHDSDGSRASMLCVGRDITDEHAAKAEAARARAEIDALRRLAQKIASLDDARQAVVNATLELTGAVFAGIAEPDRQRSKLEIDVASNPEVVGMSIDLATESSLVGQAYLSGRTVLTDDIEADPTHHRRLTPLLGSRAVVHQPIVGANGTMGVMTVGWEEPLEGAQDHALELVRLVAHEAAVALRRRESLAALERAALVDPLTSVANRRAFDAELPTALRRAGESGKPLSLVVMDLNHFKEVNDVHGHEAGDAVLIACAAAWVDALRAGDLLARLGGDEFAVLLPSCDEMEMHHVIERLRAATPHGPGSAIGGATWDGVEPGSQFVRRADDAQYRDKAAGRDPARPATPARSVIDHGAPREDPRED